MLRRFRQLLVAFLVVLLAVYVVVTNNQSVTIQLGSWVYSAAVGVVLLAAFAAGVLLTATIGLIFGLAAYLRERRLERRERDRLAFYEGMVEARSHAASADWARAHRSWESIVRRDPTHIIARIELSRSLQNQGEAREALRVLDEARAAAPHNVEVLFRAAELNMALGNRTAAMDNLALVLYHQPNRHAARLARDLSEELGRIEDAFEYQAKLDALGADDADADETRARLRFKRLLQEAEAPGAQKDRLSEDLREFVKKHPACLPAVEKLAALEIEEGRSDAAAQLLVKAAKISGAHALWRKVSRIWINGKNPANAISSARTAAHEARGEARLLAELELIRLYASLGMIEEALRELAGFEALATQEGVPFAGEFFRQYLILSGLCHSLRRDYREAHKLWEKLCDEHFELSFPAGSTA